MTPGELKLILVSLRKSINEVTKQIGPKGDKGDKGDTGDSIKGEKGDRGDQGVGIDGRDGDIGPKGEDGKDGVSVTDVALEVDDTLTFSFSDGQQTNIDLPLTQGYGDTIINRVNGGGGGQDSTGSAKDVFVSDTEPAASTDQFLWIQTGLGENGDCFTAWFNDPNH